jgi:hypothetical protein
VTSQAHTIKVYLAFYTMMVYSIFVIWRRSGKPTYNVEAFKAAFCLTGAGLRGAAALGFGRAEIVATLQTMQRPHFTNR